jgi:hypothetical protein
LFSAVTNVIIVVISCNANTPRNIFYKFEVEIRVSRDMESMQDIFTDAWET